MGRWVESLWWADTESLWQRQVAWCGGTSSGPLGGHHWVPWMATTMLPGWTPLFSPDDCHCVLCMDTTLFPGQHSLP